MATTSKQTRRATEPVRVESPGVPLNYGRPPIRRAFPADEEREIRLELDEEYIESAERAERHGQAMDVRGTVDELRGRLTRLSGQFMRGNSYVDWSRVTDILLDIVDVAQAGARSAAALRPDQPAKVC